MKVIKLLVAVITVIFLIPSMISIGLWYLDDHPDSWRNANWQSAGLLPEPSKSKPAAVYIFSAKTGGLKGALSSHAWIVTKEESGDRYNRYDKVGWGSPIRQNNYPADANWYSNAPRLVKAIHGDEAAKLIPKIENAIAEYPNSKPGGYTIYPGPNSNTFVAHVLRQVPELNIVLPSDGVGRDYLADGSFFYIAPDYKDMSLSLGGLMGISAGLRSGFEINFLGLVAGIDIQNLGIKIPALGFYGFENDQIIAKET